MILITATKFKKFKHKELITDKETSIDYTCQ